MRFRDDTRGVTVQVGAVLLFATLIIALSVYQATVVPSENADVEYRHSQQVQGQLVDVRNALVSTAETGDARPATVSLGTEYPNRVFLVNPPPAAGTLRTEAYNDSSIEVSNVNATNPETRDYLNGSWVQPTTSLSFVPGYNEYRDAPRLRYEASLLSNYYPEQNTSVPLTEQLLVDDETRTISLVALNGSLSTSRSSSVALDPAALSAPSNKVQVQANNSSQPVNVTIPTVVDASVLRNSTSLGDNPNVTVTQNGTNRVTLSVDWDDPFTLRAARVGVGSGTTNPPAHYLTLVEADDDSVTVEARDEYNNPESGVRVNVSENPDVFEDADGNKTTNEDGRVTFDVDGDQSETEVSFELVDGKGDLRERTVNETVGESSTLGAGSGSGGAYTVRWNKTKIAAQNPGLDCDTDGCVLNGSQQSSVTLFANSTPRVDSGNFEFSLSNTSIGTVSPDSNMSTASGETATTFSASDETADGESEYVYVSSGGSGDRLRLTIDELPGLVYNGDGQTGVVDSSLQFSVTNNEPTDRVVTDIRVDPANSNIARLDDPTTMFGQYASEFYMTTPGDGDEYTTDFAEGDTVPQEFDLSEGQPGTDTTHLIESGETAEYTLYEFLGADGSSFDMSGESVDIELFFQNGESTSFTVTAGDASGESADQVSTVDGSTPAGEDTALLFDIENTGSSDVTVTDFSISTPGVPSVDDIDRSTGQEEVEILNGGTDGNANADDPPSFGAFDTDGTTYGLDTEAVLTSGSQASVDMGEFNDGNVALTYSLTDTAANSDLTVTLTFADGSTKGVYFRVTNVNS